MYIQLSLQLAVVCPLILVYFVLFTSHFVSFCMWELSDILLQSSSEFEFDLTV